MRRLLIALRAETPSPESRFLASVASSIGEVRYIDPWDVKAFTTRYDLAICVGPVASCPVADKKILFAFGPSACHRDLGWDCVVATSEVARDNLAMRFGLQCSCLCIPVPLLEMESGRRRLMEEWQVSLYASPLKGMADVNMCLWGRLVEGQVPFSTMEFNSLCRNGAYGLYVDADGFDVQVRRHLAFGSPVVVAGDSQVLPEWLRDKVFRLEDLSDDGKPPVRKVDPVEDQVLTREYEASVRSVIRRV